MNGIIYIIYLFKYASTYLFFVAFNTFFLGIFIHVCVNKLINTHEYVQAHISTYSYLFLLVAFNSSIFL